MVLGALTGPSAGLPGSRLHQPVPRLSIRKVAFTEAGGLARGRPRQPDPPRTPRRPSRGVTGAPLGASLSALPPALHRLWGAWRKARPRTQPPLRRTGERVQALSCSRPLNQARAYKTNLRASAPKHCRLGPSAQPGQPPLTQISTGLSGGRPHQLAPPTSIETVTFTEAAGLA